MRTVSASGSSKAAGNPFDVPLNGGRPPEYLERADFAKLATRFGVSLGRGHFANGLIVGGLRGTGKTLELRRLASELPSHGVLALQVNGAAVARSSLAVALKDALLKSTGQRAASTREMKLSAKGRVPFTNIEVAAEHLAKAAPRDIGRELIDLATSATPSPMPIAILIDEADLLDPSELQTTVFKTIETASFHDAPIGAALVFANPEGTWRFFREASTNAPDLFDEVTLRRFDTDQVKHWLVSAAARGGQDWSSLPLARVAEISHGIPRRMMSIAGRLWGFGEVGDIGGAEIERAVAEETRRLEEQVKMFTHEPVARQVYEFVCAIDGNADARFLTYGWAPTVGIDAASALGAFDTLAGVGVFEVTARGTFVTPPRAWSTISPSPAAIAPPPPPLPTL